MKQEIDQRLIKLIKDTRKLYNDREEDYDGKIIIGWEHKITIRSPKLPIKITKQESEDLLIKDLDKIMKAIKKLVKVELTNNQIFALTSLIYDIGIPAFRYSELLTEINKENTIRVALLFKRWSKYLKTPVYKLAKRRKIEVALYLESNIEKDL